MHAEGTSESKVEGERVCAEAPKKGPVQDLLSSSSTQSCHGQLAAEDSGSFQHIGGYGSHFSSPLSLQGHLLACFCGPLGYAVQGVDSAASFGRGRRRSVQPDGQRISTCLRRSTYPLVVLHSVLVTAPQTWRVGSSCRAPRRRKCSLLVFAETNFGRFRGSVSRAGGEVWKRG